MTPISKSGVRTVRLLAEGAMVLKQIAVTISDEAEQKKLTALAADVEAAIVKHSAPTTTEKAKK